VPSGHLPPSLHRVSHATHHLRFPNPALGNPVPGYLLFASGRPALCLLEDPPLSSWEISTASRCICLLPPSPLPTPVCSLAPPLPHWQRVPNTPRVLLSVSSPLPHRSHLQLGPHQSWSPGTHGEGDRFGTQQSLLLSPGAPSPTLPISGITRASREGNQHRGGGRVSSGYKPALFLSWDPPCPAFPRGTSRVTGQDSDHLPPPLHGYANLAAKSLPAASHGFPPPADRTSTSCCPALASRWIRFSSAGLTLQDLRWRRGARKRDVQLPLVPRAMKHPG